jgi:hypothetical protein
MMPQPDGQADRDWKHALSDDSLQHIGLACPKSHADPNLGRPLRDRVRNHSINPNRGHQKRQAGEGAKEQHGEAPVRYGSRDDLFHCPNTVDGLVVACLENGAAHRRNHG